MDISQWFLNILPWLGLAEDSRTTDSVSMSRGSICTVMAVIENSED